MAGFFGSMKKMAVKTPGGQTGYTSRRRREALEGAGYTLDSNGFIVDPNASGGAVGGGGGGSAMTQFASVLPQMLSNQTGFTSPAAAQLLASLFGQPAPGWTQGAVTNAPPLSGPNPFVGAGGGMPSGNKFDLMSMIGGRMTGLPGEVGGATPGQPGPAENPFLSIIQRYGGTLGNGGGSTVPAISQPGRSPANAFAGFRGGLFNMR